MLKRLLSAVVVGAVAKVLLDKLAGTPTDVVDQDSNNETRTATRTEVEDSYNTDVDG